MLSPDRDGRLILLINYISLSQGKRSNWMLFNVDKINNTSVDCIEIRSWMFVKSDLIFLLGSTCGSNTQTFLLLCHSVITQWLFPEFSAIQSLLCSVFKWKYALPGPFQDMQSSISNRETWDDQGVFSHLLPWWITLSVFRWWSLLDPCNSG